MVIDRNVDKLKTITEESDEDTTATADMDSHAHCSPSPTSPQVHQPTGRCCFVTVGATARFRALLDEVTTAEFLDCLAKHGYTSLIIQCGKDHDAIQHRIASLSDEEKRGISVRCFDYTSAMTNTILGCRGEENVRLAGCVISHGGTGTIGEVLGIGAPLIVVPNPTLMDNHQLELADTLEAQRLAVHGHLGSLDAALHSIADRITQGTLDALPAYKPPPFPVPAADRVTFFDWMVLTCYPDEFATQMRASELGLAEAEFAAKQQQQQYDQPGGAVASDNTPAASIDSQDKDTALQFD